MTAVVAFDEFEIDRARSELRRAGRPLKVDALVIDLLVYLVSRGGALVTHDELIKHVWGGRAVSDNVVSVCVAKLRKALGHRRGERELIVNVYGRGYRFVPAVRELPAMLAQTGLSIHTPRAGVPFVGRESIVTRLTSTLAAARHRHGCVCALLGEPGIGKTRIAEALEQQALAADVNVAWGRTRELEGAPPFWPWVELLRALLAAVTVEKAEAHLGRSFAELARILPELRSTPGACAFFDDDSARYRTFAAIASLLAFAGQQTPWLLVLDDMHRADAASLELLSYLADEIARLPMTIVVTLRSTEPRRSAAEQRHVDYVLGHRNCERIEVTALSRHDVATCTEVFLGHRNEALSRAVFDKSEGNPFFMTELLRELGEGHVAEDDRTLARLSLPAPALDLVRQRIRRVGDDALGFLKAAAVLGRSFELGLLARVTQVPAATLLESFDHALATDFIIAAPEGTARFAFGHDLIRAVLYDGLPKAERAALHLRVASALSELADEGREVAPAELAHHYLSSLPHGDPIRAAEHGERAADAAMNAVAYADAAAMLRRAHAALDLAAEPAPRMRCRLHYRMSVCLRVSDARESVAELRKAVALARNTASYRLLALAGQAMVRSPGVVMIEDGRGVLEDALAGLAEDDHALRATVLAHLAWCAPHCFDREHVQALGTQATAHARASGSKVALITTLRTQIYFGGGPCRPASETQRMLEEADQLAAEDGHLTRVNWSNQASALRASFALQRGDRAGIERALETIGQSAKELQHAELIWHSDRLYVIDRMNRGELREAATLLRGLRKRGKSMQLFAFEQVCGNDTLVLLRQTSVPGDPAFVLSSASQASPQDSPGVLALKLRAAADMNRPDVARNMFAEFVQRDYERMPCDRDYVGVLCHLARVAVTLEEHAHAERLFKLLQPYAAYFAVDISFHSDGSVAHVLGLLARALGRRDEAIALFTGAAVSNERMAMRARAAESRFELGATLLTGDATERCAARELLVQARSAAKAIGFATLDARIGSLLDV